MSSDVQGSRMPSILVAGLGKTGTTGVYTSIKRAVGDRAADYAFMFEPARPDPLLALGRYQPYRPVLAKVMVARLSEGVARYADFDRRVMTVRDPRDIVVSRLLFRPLIRSVVGRTSAEDLDTFLDALREKEREPASWSVLQLHQLADKLKLQGSAFNAMVGNLETHLRILDTETFFVQRYEDFVGGRLDELSDYLGFAVASEAAAEGSWLAHIPRSKSSGAWRHWFTASDVDYFGDMFRWYLDRFDYTETELEANPVIDPATSSDYLQREIAQRRVQVEHRYNASWTVADTTTTAQVEQLREMAGDGDAEATLRLALVLDAGVAGAAPDRAAAVAAAREGAVRGHVGAMEVLGAWLLACEDDHSVLEGRMWARESQVWREVESLRGPARRSAAAAATDPEQHNDRLQAELREARRAAKRLQQSAEYRLSMRLGPLLRIGRWLRAARRRTGKP